MRTTNTTLVLHRTRTCSHTGVSYGRGLIDKSDMNRQVHVRFCEGGEEKFPRAARLDVNHLIAIALKNFCN